MILNATSEYNVVFLYLFWITTIFQTNILFKTSKCHHGGPLGAESPGQLPPLPATLNPVLVQTTIARNASDKWFPKILQVMKKLSRVLQDMWVSCPTQGNLWHAFDDFRYSCANGYELVGSSVTTCADVGRKDGTGDWTTPMPECKRMSNQPVMWAACKQWRNQPKIWRGQIFSGGQIFWL